MLPVSRALLHKMAIGQRQREPFQTPGRNFTRREQARKAEPNATVFNQRRNGRYQEGGRHHHAPSEGNYGAPVGGQFVLGPGQRRTHRPSAA